MFSILAGMVCFWSALYAWEDTEEGKQTTFEYLQHLKNGVMRTKPTL